MLPSLFISHGSPTLCIEHNNSSEFLKNLSSLFPEPKYILVISSHWITNDLKILSYENPKLIYDFFGFPQELYEQTYPIKNDLKKVNEIVKILENRNISISKDNLRDGYDHGVWSPLSLIYPKANIPVIQISFPQSYTIDDLLNLGIALKEIRKDTLIISSGSMTHNLKDLVWKENATIKQYCVDFRNWIVDKLENSNIDDLKEFLTKAPNVKENHPTLEHFLPLFINIGTSKNYKGESLNNEYMYGNLSMDTIIFKE